MRLAVLSVLVTLSGLVVAAPSGAAPVIGPGIERAAPELQDAARRRCARGYHFVPAHRLANGKPVRARCVRDRRRR